MDNALRASLIPHSDSQTTGHEDVRHSSTLILKASMAGSRRFTNMPTPRQVGGERCRARRLETKELLGVV